MARFHESAEDGGHGGYTVGFDSFVVTTIRTTNGIPCQVIDARDGRSLIVAAGVQGGKEGGSENFHKTIFPVLALCSFDKRNVLGAVH